MQEFNARLKEVEGDVHSIRTDVAVLRSEFDGTLKIVGDMATDVKQINETMQQQKGAVTFVRFAWAVIGAGLAVFAAYIAYKT